MPGELYGAALCFSSVVHLFRKNAVTLHRREAPEVFCGTRRFARVSNRIAGG